MHTIAIFFTAPRYDDYPFDEPEYAEAYHLLARLLQERGRDCAIVRDPHTYRGGTRFQGGWRYREGCFERFEEEAEYDLLFNKGRFRPDDGAPVINHPALEYICTDKWATYQTFRELCPATIRAENARDAAAAVATLQSALAVAKPIDLEGGEGVIVARKEEIVARIPSYPYLLQEFIDTSGGIEGVADGPHDFRLILINGEIVSTLLRMPKKGSYLANVAQGGSKRIVDLQDIPESARDMCRRIDASLAHHRHRIYSVDLACDLARTWKIIELNSQPGLSIHDYTESETGKRLFNGLADLLACAA